MIYYVFYVSYTDRIVIIQENNYNLNEIVIFQEMQ